MNGNANTVQCRHKQLYKCPRCGHISKQIGHYRSHISKKRMCAPDLADVLPTADNVHVVQANDNTINNNTINTGNTVNNINISIMPSTSLPQHKKLMHFPFQNLDHVSPDFKRYVVDLASKADGFVQAVQKMFEVTYFDQSQPHNMNIIISDANTDVAHVFERGDKWKAMHADAAIKEMLDNQGDAIRNFPDEPGLDGTIPPSRVHAIDTKYDDASFVQDPGLITAVKNMAIESNGHMSSVLGPFHQLAIGMAHARAYRPALEGPA